MLEFKLIRGMDGYLAAKTLRQSIFTEELGFGEDQDELDQTAWHIVGYDRGEVIGCARMYPVGEGIFQIGRVSVKKEYRKAYVGDTMMRALEDKAVSLCGYKTVVSAQKNAVGFYEKEGYVKVGEEYSELNFPHQRLEKDLTKPHRRCQCHA